MDGSVAKCKEKKKRQGITQFQFKRPSRKDETVVSKKRVNKFVRPVARDLVTTGTAKGNGRVHQTPVWPVSYRSATRATAIIMDFFLSPFFF